MFSFAHLHFDYDPYPIGLATKILPPDLYTQLVKNWPPQEIFEFKKNLGNKYSLSEVNHPQLYHDYIRTSPPWLEVYKYIKSPSFIQQVLQTLCAHHLDLGLQNRHISQTHHFSSVGEWSQALVTRLIRRRAHKAPLSARFEFSMLPAAGGFIKPHTDAPQKLITLVVSMVGDEEWNPAYGGGTDVLRPCDITKNFNFLNEQLEFDEVEVLKTFPFETNQCLVFVKTFNSLHSVQPLQAPGSSVMRKTVTINIESWQ